MTLRGKERLWWIRTETWQVTNKMWEGSLVENNHCKIFRLIKLGLFLTYFPSASVTHAGSSKASHRYCHLIIKTCNWSGSVSSRGSSEGTKSCERERNVFLPMWELPQGCHCVRRSLLLSLPPSLTRRYQPWLGGTVPSDKGGGHGLLIRITKWVLHRHRAQLPQLCGNA